MGVNAVFSQLTSTLLTAGDHIRSQYVFADYYEGFGFFGGLITLSTDEMYAVKVTREGGATLTVSGTPVALPKPITLNSGWSFIPCPHQAATGLTAAMPTHTYANGDQIKSQLQFAEYYGFGFGWYIK